jgi:hypothetical protein
MIHTNLFRLFSKLFFFLSLDLRLIIYKKLNSILTISIWFKGPFKYDIIIFDDVFPSTTSPWRTFEFVNILYQFPNSKIVSNSLSKSFLKNESFSKRYNDLIRNYPEIRGKINKERFFENVNSKIIYFLFFNNVLKYLDKLKKSKSSFVFTLYPGGGWEIENNEKDQIIYDLIDLPFCKAVIVNQYLTYNYLINKLKVDSDKVFLIPGIPLPLTAVNDYRTNFPKDPVIKIVFVAHKYTFNGIDKGFPIFIKFINRIKSKTNIKFNAYVIGDFTKDDLQQDGNWLNLFFMGRMDEDSLNVFLKETDVIISPNQPFKLKKGAYDGFPLGSVISAGLNNNLILSTDFFNEGEKIGFIDTIHFVKIDPNDNDIFNKFIHYYYDSKSVKEIIFNCKLFISRFYSYDNQIVPRFELIKNLIK